MTEQSNKGSFLRICLISPVPSTLLIFYGGLIRQLMQESVDVTVVSSPTPNLYRIRDQLGCKIFPLEIARGMSVLKDVITICKLTSYLRRENYDIIHAHTPKGGLLGMISAFLTRVPIRVYTMHGLLLDSFTGQKRKLLWLIEWLTCKLATDVLLVSYSVKQRVVQEKLWRLSKMRILGDGTACGIDLEKFNRTERTAILGRQVRQKLNIPENAIIVGYVGRIIPDKGIKCLVKAFEIVLKQLDNAYLLLIGAFETVIQTIDQKTIDMIKINDNIKSTGHVEDVMPFYAAMDIVVLPSRREGFGMVLIEAGAMELPTIATRVTGCVDAVVDNVTGLLVEKDNDKQFAEAILKLARSGELRNKLGREGSKRTRKLFGSKRLIAEHMALYEKLLGNEVQHRDII
jgi:glycosyltransferase involved in cell wall biosynthesis